MQYQVITHYDSETRGLWTSTSLPMSAEQLTGYIAAKHRNYTSNEERVSKSGNKFLRYEILPVTEPTRGRREVVAQALADYFRPLGNGEDTYLETDLGQAEFVLEALDRWDDEHGPTEEDLKDQKTRLRNILGWKICAINHYPEKARPYLLGVNMDEIVDSVADYAWKRGVRLSFDLDIVTRDVDGNEIVHEVVCGHTYNLSPMWHLALPFLEGTSSLHNRNCGALVPLLEEGLADIAIREDAYRALNPKNGWGDFEGFLGIYKHFTQLCAKYPSGRVCWSG